MTNHKKTFTEKMTIGDSVSARTESWHLITSNKKRCTQILQKDTLTEEDIIDLLIALHVVLEVSLNSLFRNLSLMGIKKGIDEFEIAKNIDEINFIHKTTLFIYNAKFDFNGKLDEATRYHSIIGKLKDFAAPRNKLLHGHTISTVFAAGSQRHSSLRMNVTRSSLNNQIQKFREILEGVRFYLDCLDSSLTQSGKESFKREYLDDSFLV